MVPGQVPRHPEKKMAKKNVGWVLFTHADGLVHKKFLRFVQFV